MTKLSLVFEPPRSISHFSCATSNDFYCGSGPSPRTRPDPIRHGCRGDAGSPQLLPLSLVVPDEVAILAGVHVVVDGDEEPLVELEGAGELLRQLPHTLQELVHDRGHLLGVPVQVVTPGERRGPGQGATETDRGTDRDRFRETETETDRQTRARDSVRKKHFV